MLSSGYYDASYLKAQKVRTLLRRDFETAFASVDLLVAPVCPTTAFKIGEKTSDPLEMYLSDIHPRAAADFEQAQKIDSNDYTALWLYLARKRGNVLNAEEMLDEETRPSRTGGWPTPVILLYLGRTDAASVLAASTDQDVRRQRDSGRCGQARVAM